MHHRETHDRAIRGKPWAPHVARWYGDIERRKRILDVLLSLIGMALTLPLMVVCGLWIKLVDGGPVLYKQWRVGYGGWLFCLFKLRTMRTDAERSGAARFASRGDPRILPGCAWMRKSHVDELPQLWNILLGQMSLIGPRPERPEMIESLRQWLPKIDRRLLTRPGLTGLAQIYNGYANDVAGARRKLALDLKYMRHRGMVADLQLLLRTIPKLWDRAAR